MIRHLRDNAVAYLALMVALGGTSYAAIEIPKGSVTTSKLAANAVTTGKIKNSTISSKDVKDGGVTGQDLTDGTVTGQDLTDGTVSGQDLTDGTVSAQDLTVGVVPADAFIFQAMTTSDDPVAAPDTLNVLTRVVTLPRAGTAHVRFFGGRFSAACSAGSAQAGLYLDGAPLAGTRRIVQATGSESAIELLASVPVTAGSHTLTYGVDCPTGSLQLANVANGTWTVVLAAD